MKYYIIQLSVFVFLLFQCIRNPYSIVEVSTQTSKNLFEKIVFSNGNTEAYDICETQDSCFLVVGSIEDDLSSDKDIHIVKINPTGDVLWTKSLKSENDNIAHRVLSLKNGSLVILSNSKISGINRYSTLILKISLNGDSLTSKYFNEQYSDMIISETESLILTGTSSNNNIKFSSLDINLNVEMDKNIIPSGIGSDKSSRGYSIRKTTDNYYIISGSCKYHSYSGDGCYLVKIDGDGNIVWDINYQPHANWTESYIGKTLSINSNNEIIVGGEKYWGSDASSMFQKEYLLFKTTPSGSIKWTHLFGDYLNQNVSCEYTMFLADHSIISMGTVDLEGKIYSHNSIGEKNWEKTISNSQINSAIETRDFGLFFVGTITIEQKKNIYILKTDYSGSY